MARESELDTRRVWTRSANHSKTLKHGKAEACVFGKCVGFAERRLGV